MRFFKINCTKFFNTVLFIVMFLVLISQVSLLTPSVRQVLSNTGLEESLYAASNPQGELTLELSGVTPNSDIIILQNGEPTAVFFEKTMQISVSDNTVIEIDGCKIEKPFSVTVIKKSSNIQDFDTQTVTVDQNIAMLGRIFLK